MGPLFCGVGLEDAYFSFLQLLDARSDFIYDLCLVGIRISSWGVKVLTKKKKKSPSKSKTYTKIQNKINMKIQNCIYLVLPIYIYIIGHTNKMFLN